MGAFIIRRLLGMVAVLFVVSFIVFVIFIMIPGGDPAARIAGKNRDRRTSPTSASSWGFDKPFYVQYVRHDAEDRELVYPEARPSTSRYTRHQPDVVAARSSAGFPRRSRSAIGAAIIWLFFGILVGVISAVTRGRLSDRAITVARADRDLACPSSGSGSILRYFLAENARRRSSRTAATCR